MSCRGCSRKPSKRCRRREARRKNRCESSKARLRLRQGKVAQSAVILAYYLSIRYSGALTNQGGIGAVLHFQTSMTAVITAGTLAFSLWGSRSKVPIALSIAGDSICLTLHLLGIISLFVAKRSVRCFTGNFEREGPSCGLIWSSLLVFNVLLSASIHNIVSAAILISALKSQSRERLPVSNEDTASESSQTQPPDEEPPPYPASDTGLPGYPDAETFRLDEDVGRDRKGRAQDTLFASSSIPDSLVAATRVSEDSNDSDEAGEDRPLLRF